ncbi:MAG: TerB family tellurite resistance protein [Nitrospiraceae bacterium]|jgi:uncharacterized tellurite resistance protein B-like protein|nr:MAG: TerB family tellurite resistance protein [Nitrospiraceae bacterium]
MLRRIGKVIGLKDAVDEPVVQNKLNIELLATVLLLEAAHADYECSEEELEHVIETVKSLFNLPHEHVEELLEFAHSERGTAVDLYEFTRRANDKMSRDEKCAIVEAVWRIVYADGQIDKHEEHFVRRLANLLWLEHKDFITAKLRARDRS